MKIFCLAFAICGSALAFSPKNLEQYLFESPPKGVRTDAFEVYKDGERVFSRYDQGSPESLHLLWSMSKSISSLLFGVAESKGIISREDKLEKFFPKTLSKFKGKDQELLKSIKLKNILNMASGLNWDEFYEEDPFNSNVVEMLYLKSKGSMGEYALSVGRRKAPGEGLHYSSGDTMILTTAMMRSMQGELKSTYPWKWLFGPIEMEAIFERDGEGAFIGSSYAYLKTKDLAKLGHLILNRGRYKGKQVVPAKYIEYATSLSEALKKKGCLTDDYMTYGAQFWLNASCPNGKRPFPSVSDKLVMMLGHGGQSVFIFPEKGIVAVRIARDEEKALDKETYGRLLVEAFNEK
mgnify:CR=1 FL=1